MWLQTWSAFRYYKIHVTLVCNITTVRDPNVIVYSRLRSNRTNWTNDWHVQRVKWLSPITSQKLPLVFLLDSTIYSTSILSVAEVKGFCQSVNQEKVENAVQIRLQGTGSAALLGRKSLIKQVGLRLLRKDAVDAAECSVMERLRLGTIRNWPLFEQSVFTHIMYILTYIYPVSQILWTSSGIWLIGVLLFSWLQCKSYYEQINDLYHWTVSKIVDSCFLATTDWRLTKSTGISSVK